MSPRRAIALVARREVVEGVRSRAWRASLAIQVALVVGIAVVSIVTSDDGGPSKRDVAVIGPEAARIAAQARAAEAGYGIELTIERSAGPAAARTAVRDEEVDAALVGKGLTIGESPDDALVALLQNAARVVAGKERLRAAGLSAKAAEAALEPPPLRTTEVAPKEGKGGSGLAYLGALLLYIAIITFGYAIASSVISEKSSRVVEVILSAIRPVQLLAGKVIGVGLLGLLQIAAIGSAGIAVALLGGNVSLPSTTAETLVLVLVYFVLGYAFYGCAFAGVASLVSRQEDSQSTTAPLLVILIGSYIATNSALGDPGGSLAQIGAYLPPMAPMLVPGLSPRAPFPPGSWRPRWP